MGNPSKRKGSAYERELVMLAKAFGLRSQRAYASNGRSLGLAEEVDLVVDEYRVQAKRRKRLPKFLQIPLGCDVVATRMDNAETYVLMHYRRFLELVKAKRDGSK
jgi:hypothetical protein